MKEAMKVEMLGDIELSERQIDVIAKIFMEELKMDEEKMTEEAADGVERNVRCG